MKLVSTRDSHQEQTSYTAAIIQGLAPDGGLYVPQEYPVLDRQVLQELSGRPYVDIFLTIKRLFVDDISPDQQATLARQAYSPENFPDAKDGNIVPVTEIDAGLYIQNLSLGPTAAFKDMALQPLARDMQYVLSRQKKTLRLLGATSGDTGSAAEAAAKNLDTMQLFMLSPAHGMSAFQSAQMAQLSGGNIYNLTVAGTFDDCQDLVKRIKRDSAFADMGAVNSINWGRVVAQIPYYVAGYLQVAGQDIGQPVDFVVPTGNFGNLLAGHIARRMGVPIRRLIAATNENDVLHRLIQTGQYAPGKAVITSAPSMDISKPSNYERLLYDILDGNPDRVREYMDRLERDGSVSFADAGKPADALRRLDLDSGSANHQARLRTIEWVYRTAGRVIDPHTAAAVYVARQKRTPDVPIICMETALPVKFEPTIREALGFVPPRPARFRGLEAHTKHGFAEVANDIEQLKDFIREHAAD